MKIFTRDQVRKKLIARLGEYDTNTAAAADIGCTKSEISTAVHGDGVVNFNILNALGLERVYVYRAKDGT